MHWHAGVKHANQCQLNKLRHEKKVKKMVGSRCQIVTHIEMTCVSPAHSIGEDMPLDVSRLLLLKYTCVVGVVKPCRCSQNLQRSQLRSSSES